MYVNVAVLKETLPHERRVALVPDSAGKQPALVQRLLDRKITCFAMQRIPRITRPQSMDALSSQSALAGYCAVQLGATHLARVLPTITSAAAVLARMIEAVRGLGSKAAA